MVTLKNSSLKNTCAGTWILELDRINFGILLGVGHSSIYLYYLVIVLCLRSVHPWDVVKMLTQSISQVQKNPNIVQIAFSLRDFAIEHIN